MYVQRKLLAHYTNGRPGSIISYTYRTNKQGCSCEQWDIYHWVYQATFFPMKWNLFLIQILYKVTKGLVFQMTFVRKSSGSFLVTSKAIMSQLYCIKYFAVKVEFTHTTPIFLLICVQFTDKLYIQLLVEVLSLLKITSVMANCSLVNIVLALRADKARCTQRGWHNTYR